MKKECEEIVSLDCSKCGSEIGQFVIIKGQEFLRVGGILSTGLHGVCIQCGKEFHWSQRDRKLSKLLNDTTLDGATSE